MGGGAIIDISPRISARTAVFPGDVPLSREVMFDMKNGDVLTLSAMRSTVHLGSHADAPSHYLRDGRTIEAQPIEIYWGLCEVIGVRARVGVAAGSSRRVGREDLDVDARWVPSTPRLLLATRSYANPEAWATDFLALDPALVDWLADAGVLLVGIDTPSVDCADSKDLPAHARFAARDIAIIEGLVLDHVEPGQYELCALPLRLEGFDASPIRAALRRG
ncbi:MAG: kynurenine formamidase [Phycisphaerales bacterium]|nr:kynurenine formamidase [Phycisphaerales bacterium]